MPTKNNTEDLCRFFLFSSFSHSQPLLRENIHEINIPKKKSEKERRKNENENIQKVYFCLYFMTSVRAQSNKKKRKICMKFMNEHRKWGEWNVKIEEPLIMLIIL